MWALENGGGPLTTTGSRMRTITLTTQKPVAFELQRVWVTYTPVSYTHLTLPTKRIV